jgi:hypothetical protein
MIAEGVNRLRILHRALQDCETCDGEGLVELLREVEEELCLVLDAKPWAKGRGWASERLDQLVSMLDETDLAAVKSPKPKKKKKRSRKR